MTPGDLGLLILRLVIGLTFAAHGAQKAFGWWSGPKYSGWRAGVERMGLRPAGFWALVSTAAELGGGVLLAVGLLTPVATAALIAQSLVIVGLVHLPKGFWKLSGPREPSRVDSSVATAIELPWTSGFWRHMARERLTQVTEPATDLADIPQKSACACPALRARLRIGRLNVGVAPWLAACGAWDRNGFGGTPTCTRRGHF